MNLLLFNDEFGFKLKYGLEYIYFDLFMSFVFKDYIYMWFYISIDKICDEIVCFL